MELMALLYEILDKTRKEGLLAIERDIDAPKESALFRKYPRVLKDHHLVEFITDYLRLMVSGKLNALEIEALMDGEIDTHHHEGEIPAHALQRVADGLPAFGIVAAVMGVVHTMESVGLPPSELGLLIAHALVGTFLGILLSYGFVGAADRRARAEAARGDQGARVHQGHAARELERRGAVGRGRVRPQGALLDRASGLRGAREAREGRGEGRAPAEEVAAQ